jgi:pyruvate, water dikinase
LVADIFDERDPGVQTMLKMAVEGARRNKAHSGICGQAPSDYPEIAKFLISEGIDSISLTPDSLVKTIVAVGAIEAKSREGVAK